LISATHGNDRLDRQVLMQLFDEKMINKITNDHCLVVQFVSRNLRWLIAKMSKILRFYLHCLVMFKMHILAEISSSAA